MVRGINGAGKTTIFDSVMLCLYGISSLDGRVTQKSYTNHLSNKIHRSKKMAEHDGSSISVSFQISHAGEVQEYTVTRKWGMKGKDEKLFINSGNRNTLPNLDRSKKELQSIIDDLIPRRIARLFFFDGERIVRMVEEGESATIKSSFDTLLGLDIVRQLHRDLEVNMMRNMKGNNAHVRDEFERLVTDKKDVDERIDRLVETRVSKQSSLDSALDDVTEKEASINALGGGFAARRAEIKAMREVAAKSRDGISSRIRELCAGSLPFALIPKETAIVCTQINDDRRSTMRSMTASAVSEAAERAKKQLYDDDVWNRIADGDKLRSTLISKMIKALESSGQHTENKTVFSLSREQEEQILSTIQHANDAATIALKDDARELVKTEEEISSMDIAISSAPDDDEIGPLITKLGKVRSTIGMLEAEINHINEEISILQAQSNHIQLKTRSVISQLYEDKKAGVSVELTKNVQLALDDYAKKLTAKKLDALEDNLIEAAHTLMHKKGLFDHIQIDRNTYAITLSTRKGTPVSKDTLSKGEQQMLTIAVLWALAKTSGRPFPFMIDTPLARLDSRHRNNLIDRFFPMASHQVIIFSTDSEIGSDELEKLDQYISKWHTLKYDAEKDQTVSYEGRSGGETLAAS